MRALLSYLNPIKFRETISPFTFQISIPSHNTVLKISIVMHKAQCLDGEKVQFCSFLSNYITSLLKLLFTRNTSSLDYK